MKFLKFILIFLPLVFFSQQKIKWDINNKLTFEDFKGIVPANEIGAASMINIEYKVVSQSVWTGRIKMEIFATFDTTNSWFRQEDKSTNLLIHEQGHFDIAQSFSKKLQDRVNREIKSAEDFNEKFKNIYDNIYEEYYNLQVEYDKATDLGRDFENQTQFNARIKQMLK